MAAGNVGAGGGSSGAIAAENVEIPVERAGGAARPARIGAKPLDLGAGDGGVAGGIDGGEECGSGDAEIGTRLLDPADGGGDVGVVFIGLGNQAVQGAVAEGAPPLWVDVGLGDLGFCREA